MLISPPISTFFFLPHTFYCIRYERPGSLPTFTVDRISASTTALRKVPTTTRIGVSVLGQMQASLRAHSQTEKLLRRSFAHVSDAGQERAFFLRFRGEGVLDNGGPCVRGVSYCTQVVEDTERHSNSRFSVLLLVLYLFFQILHASMISLTLTLCTYNRLSFARKRSNIIDIVHFFSLHVGRSRHLVHSISLRLQRVDQGTTH